MRKDAVEANIGAGKRVMAISLVCSILALSLALWFGPVSLSYLLYTGLLALVVTPLFLLGWSSRSLLFRFAGIMLFLLADRPIRAIAFPDQDYWQVHIGLSIQYVATFLAVLCSIGLIYAMFIAHRKQH
jgi:hypothetical protein